MAPESLSARKTKQRPFSWLKAMWKIFLSSGLSILWLSWIFFSSLSLVLELELFKPATNFWMRDEFLKSWLPPYALPSAPLSYPVSLLVIARLAKSLDTVPLRAPLLFGFMSIDMKSALLLLPPGIMRFYGCLEAAESEYSSSSSSAIRARCWSFNMPMFFLSTLKRGSWIICWGTYRNSRIVSTLCSSIWS